MDILDAENEMIPIDVMRFSSFSYDTPPSQSSTDEKEYSVIKLNNGLTALLISESAVAVSQPGGEEGGGEIEDGDDADDFGFDDDDDDDESASLSGSYVEEESVSQSESSIGVSILEEDSISENIRFGLSACAICVDVGSFHDPEEMPGTAHLLQHVIAAGSRTYPGDDRFESMLNEVGGSYYSSTDCECTTYYFDCHEESLNFFLDRFSKQLISPILDHDTVEDEIANMKFEFQNDDWYNNDMSRNLILCSTAEKNNPARKLVNGHRITDEDVSLNTALKYICEFWKKNYSAHRITLAIQSRHSLKTLELWVEEYFYNIPCNNLPAEVFPSCDAPFITEEFCKFFTVESIEEEELLEISWVLPSVVKLYRSKPLDYIKWFVVQEGTGSLVAYLRMKNWASKVSCHDHDSELDCNSIYSIFSITVHLTNIGINNLEETLRVVFSHITFLRESIPVEWIFSEIKSVADILFTHSTNTSPLNNVKRLVKNMRLYPPVDYIKGEHIFFEFDANIITQLLNLMKPDKANIMVTSKNESNNVELDNVEHWLGIRYNKKNYTTEFEEDRTLKEYFCLPKANPFIVNDFQLLPPPEEVMIYPEVISKSHFYEAWYKQETKFQKPEGCLVLKFTSTKANQSVRSYVTLELLTLALDRLLRQEIYSALTCGFQYSLDVSEDGFIIVLYGFNEKLGLLLEYVMRCLKKSEGISDLVSDAEYDAFYRKVISKSYLENKPFKLCYQLILKVIFTPSWTYFDKFSLHKAEPLLKSSLDSFAKHFLETSNLKCFFNGNISRTQAMEMVNSTINATESSSAISEQKSCLRVSELPIGELLCKVQSFDNTSTNHYIINYYQYGVSDMEKQCELKLVIFFMKEYIANRPSKEQIICRVFDYPYEKEQEVMGILVAVKSKEDLQLIDSNTREFLTNFSLYLEEQTVYNFEQLRAKFIKNMLYKAGDLIDETNKLWIEISNYSHMFDRQKREIEATKKIRLEDIRATFKKLIDTSSIRKLRVQVEASNCSSDNLIEDDTNIEKTNSNQTSEPALMFIDSKTKEKRIIKGDIDMLKSTQFFSYF